jgi:hypothetical protein
MDFFVFGGDANHDRRVNFDDLVILAQNYNTSSRTFADGDFNYDGTVNFSDLVVLAQHYNTTFAGPTAGATDLPSALLPARPALARKGGAITSIFSTVPVVRPPSRKPLPGRKG